MYYDPWYPERSSSMESLLGTETDLKNIGLAKGVFDLRQDLDLYAIMMANWAAIEFRFGVAGLFPQIRRRTLGGIILGVCKIYEVEGKAFRLNSIDGIMKELKKDAAKPVSDSPIHDFVKTYYGASISQSAITALELTIKTFKEKYDGELRMFKEARDKVIAHSEFLLPVDTAPSYDVMEKLFWFGAGFYKVVVRGFLGSEPDDIKQNRPVMNDFIRLLETLGIKDVKTTLE
jgi:hypothetical protein